jgi:hypothetical protein
MVAIIKNINKQQGYFLSLFFLLLMMMSAYMLLMINIIIDLKKEIDQYHARIYLQKNILMWVKNFSKKNSTGSESVVLADKTIIKYQCEQLINVQTFYRCEALISKGVVSEQVEFVLNNSVLSLRYLNN